MQGAGVEQTHPAVSSRSTARPSGDGARRLAGIALAAVGVLVMLGGLLDLSVTARRALDQEREVGTSAETQRFAFDHGAWQAIPADELFPRTYSTRASSAGGAAVHLFTRIAAPTPARCTDALDPALVALLSADGCGPVLRADYTDATQTTVATVGLVVLHSTPAQQADLALATADTHDDLRPRALAAPGTAAASFGDAQRLAHQVRAPSDHPYVFVAVSGFADGRPAGADVGREVVTQSGLDLVVADLAGLVHRQTVSNLETLWSRRPA